MGLSIQERLERRRKTNGRANFDEQVEDSPAPVADILVTPDVKQRIKKREQAAFLPMDEKSKVFDELSSTALENTEQLTTNLQHHPQQTPNKLPTNFQQTSNKLPTNEMHGAVSESKTYNKLPTQPTTLPPTNLQQTPNKLTTTVGFLGLVGLQRRIVLFLYGLCRKEGARTTETVSIANLATACETTVRAAQETIRRLEKRLFIKRAEFRNGRGGWTRYELPQEVYRDLFQLETSNKLTTNLQQTSNKLPTELTTEPTTRTSSSSSSIVSENFKTTTTGEPELSENAPTPLAPEWQTVDVSPLTDVGFTQTHLLQVIRQAKLTPSEVQDSIYFFAFDLKRNGKGRELNGPPLNFFMGILRKGVPYAPPENYESPADEARRRTREILERKARERAAEEERIRELEFAEWRRGVGADELATILPEFARRPGPVQDSALRTHFENEVWPERRAAIPGAVAAERAEIARQVEQSLQEGTAL